MLKDFDLKTCITPLLCWFQEHARVLPWRSDPTPYKVWVSEIMLQQTRVEAVKPYFERFMKELPDIRSLSVCAEDRLLKLWEGLGYYNRVRNMQQAARQIEEQYQGRMPSDPVELQKLKGIGSYTAGAIASIAFAQRAAAVDGNVLRVMTRLTADDTDIAKPAFRRQLEERLTDIMPEGKCGTFNQALMELGAMVCVPNGDPQCSECPWRALCLAHRNGRETGYPVKAEKKPRRIEEKTILLILDGERMVLRKRPPKGLLAGLYEFPSEKGWLTKTEAVKRVEKMGLSPLRVQALEDAKHIFTHVEWHMKGFLVRVAETEAVPEGMILADQAETEREYPIPSAYGAYTKVMRVQLGVRPAKKKDAVL